MIMKDKAKKALYQEIRRILYNEDNRSEVTIYNRIITVLDEVIYSESDLPRLCDDNDESFFLHIQNQGNH